MKAVKFTLLRRKAADIRARGRFGPIFLAAIAAVIGSILFFMFFADSWTTAAVRRLPGWCISLASFFNHLGDGYNVFIPLGVLVGIFTLTVRLGLNRTAHEVITTTAVRVIFVLSAIGASCIVSTFAKWAFGRIRPKLAKQASVDFSFFTWTYDGVGLSFPSGHTTVAFSAAFALGTLMPRLRIPLFAVAGLVGASRVVLGAHYPSDVLAGALCGVLVSALVSRAFARQRLGLVVTASGNIEPKAWPRYGRFAALAGALLGELRGRPPAPVAMQPAGPR